VQRFRGGLVFKAHRLLYDSTLCVRVTVKRKKKKKVCQDDATEDPMWGHPRPVLGALSPFLEPFRGHLMPKVDEIFQK